MMLLKRQLCGCNRVKRGWHTRIGWFLNSVTAVKKIAPRARRWPCRTETAARRTADHPGLGGGMGGGLGGGMGPSSVGRATRSLHKVLSLILSTPKTGQGGERLWSYCSRERQQDQKFKAILHYILRPAQDTWDHLKDSKWQMKNKKGRKFEEAKMKYPLKPPENQSC